jgi:hypothetical protein
MEPEVLRRTFREVGEVTVIKLLFGLIVWDSKATIPVFLD